VQWNLFTLQRLKQATETLVFDWLCSQAATRELISNTHQFYRTSRSQSNALVLSRTYEILRKINKGLQIVISLWTCVFSWEESWGRQICDKWSFVWCIIVLVLVFFWISLEVIKLLEFWTFSGVNLITSLLSVFLTRAKDNFFLFVSVVERKSQIYRKCKNKSESQVFSRFFMGTKWDEKHIFNRKLPSCSCNWREISVVYSQRKGVAPQHTQFVALVRARARISVDLRATCAA